MKILLADDHPLILHGLEAALSRVSGLEIIATCRTPAALLSMLKNTACGLVVADYAMPDAPGDGWQLFTAMLNRYPAVKVVAYTAFAEPLLVAGLQRLGVHGVVSKRDPLPQLIHAIEVVAGGSRHLSPIAQAALDEAAATPQYQFLTSLTHRELQTLGLFAAGLSVSAAARLIGRSVKTVSAQKAAVKRKIAARSDWDLYVHIAQQGLLMRPAIQAQSPCSIA